MSPEIASAWLKLTGKKRPREFSHSLGRSRPIVPNCLAARDPQEFACRKVSMRYAAALVEGYRVLDERTILIVSFGLGVAAQAALLLRNDWNWWKLGGCAVLGLMGMLPGKHEHLYQPLFHVLVSFSLFSVTFALTFSKDILPILSEAILLSYTLVFWFAFYSFYYQGGPLQTVLLIVLLVPTIATLYIAFRKTQLTFLLKLILYTWFLIIIVCLGLFQFPYSRLALFFEERQVPWITPLDSLAAGMAFLFLLANATYVFYLIPIPGKNESWEERMRHWHEFTDLMTQRRILSSQDSFLPGIGIR